MLPRSTVPALVLALVALLIAAVQPAAAQTGKGKSVWTSLDDPTLPPDFSIQGEYVGTGPGGKLGAQVIALGDGAFQAVLMPGGLPGAGWDGKNKTLLQGTREGVQAAFRPAEGKRRYLAQAPAQFSATRQFPPSGQQNWTAVNSGGRMTVQTGAGKSFVLKKVERKSPTLGQQPPAGAIILFNGSNTEQWQGGRLDKKAGTLNTDGRDIVTKQKFNDYTAHVEFLLPYRPTARGQGRGNSGFYQVGDYEVQILDSFGLDGLNNECGGIYSRVQPKLNACLPPLQWQTYDVEFTNARPDPDNPRKIKQRARITVRLNGIVILDQVEIAGRTGGHRTNVSEGTPGPLLLQGHGNPLQFRNVFVVEKQ